MFYRKLFSPHCKGFFFFFLSLKVSYEARGKYVCFFLVAQISVLVNLHETTQIIATKISGSKVALKHFRKMITENLVIVFGTDNSFI